MSDNKKYLNIRDIVLEVKKLYHFIILKWKTLCLMGLAGGAIGFCYASFSKPIYKGTLSFLLNENEPAAGLNLSSLANIAGLSGMGSSGGVNEDKLLFLANSRYILAVSMLSEREVNGKKDLLVNHYINIYKMSEGFKGDTLLADFNFFTHNKVDELTYKENKVMDRIVKQITQVNHDLKIESKKKTGIVSQNSGIVIIDYACIDEVFTKIFLEELYANLSNYYTNKTVQRQFRNYSLIKHRADSLKEILTVKENSGAGMMDRNTNLAKMSARVEIERSRRDVEMLNLMYAEVLKNLEIAKFALENQTPLFQVIDSPTLPLKMKKDSRILYTLLGGIIFGILTFVFLYIKGFFENFAAEDLIKNKVD